MSNIVPLRPAKPACSFCLKTGVNLVKSMKGDPAALICTDCAVDAIRAIRDEQDLAPAGTPLSGIGEMEPQR
jgi:hypothetical protein